MKKEEEIAHTDLTHAIRDARDGVVLIDIATARTALRVLGRHVPRSITVAVRGEATLLVQPGAWVLIASGKQNAPSLAIVHEPPRGSGVHATVSVRRWVISRERLRYPRRIPCSDIVGRPEPSDQRVHKAIAFLSAERERNEGIRWG